MPSLGLSNKAIFKTAEAERDKSSEQSGGVKNAFGDNVPTFVSVDLESKCSVKLIQPSNSRGVSVSVLCLKTIMGTHPHTAVN